MPKPLPIQTYLGPVSKMNEGQLYLTAWVNLKQKVKNSKAHKHVVLFIENLEHKKIKSYCLEIHSWEEIEL